MPSAEEITRRADGEPDTIEWVSPDRSRPIEILDRIFLAYGLS
jgi:hypothetical protein